MRKILTLILLTATLTLSTYAQNHGTLVSAASYSAGKLTSNGLASMFGSGFTTSTAGAPSLPLPTTLGGVSVQFNGISPGTSTTATAKLLFVSPLQVNLQIPNNLSAGLYTVTLT